MEGFRLVRFGRVCMGLNRRSVELESGKKYKILPGVSHVYVRAGKLSLFQSDFISINYIERKNIKTRRGLFIVVPFGAKFVEFPEFNKNPGGYHYGEPLWFAVKIC